MSLDNYCLTMACELLDCLPVRYRTEAVERALVEALGEVVRDTRQACALAVNGLDWNSPHGVQCLLDEVLLNAVPQLPELGRRLVRAA